MKAKGECGGKGRAVFQLPAGPRDLGMAWPNLGKETNSATSVYTHIPPLSNDPSQPPNGLRSPSHTPCNTGCSLGN
jgi:hypothetical protein